MTSRIPDFGYPAPIRWWTLAAAMATNVQMNFPFQPESRQRVPGRLGIGLNSDSRWATNIPIPASCLQRQQKNALTKLASRYSINQRFQTSCLVICRFGTGIAATLRKAVRQPMAKSDP
jgi:hypothetical protein